LHFNNALKYSASIVLEGNNRQEKYNSETLLFDIRMSLSEVYLNTNQQEDALINLLKVEENLKNKSTSTYSNGYFNYIYGLYFVNKGLYNNANSKFKDAVTILENNNQDKNLMLLSKTYEVLALSSAKSGNN